MKQKIKGLISVALCLMLIIQSASINAATKVKINKKTASIYVGETVQLNIKGTKKKVKWKSSNKKVATVTSKGKVKGIKKGTAKITATVSKKKYTCKVTVKEIITNNTNSNSNNTNGTSVSTTTPAPVTGGVGSMEYKPTNPLKGKPPYETVTLSAINSCKIVNVGETYTTKNGLSVCVSSISCEQNEDKYKCKVVYSFVNNTDKEIYEYRLRIFNTDGKICTQTGALWLLPKGRTTKYSYTFESYGKPYVLELFDDDYETMNLYPNELHWMIE